MCPPVSPGMASEHRDFSRSLGTLPHSQKASTKTPALEKARNGLRRVRSEHQNREGQLGVARMRDPHIWVLRRLFFPVLMPWPLFQSCPLWTELPVTCGSTGDPTPHRVLLSSDLGVEEQEPGYSGLVYPGPTWPCHHLSCKSGPPCFPRPRDLSAGPEFLCVTETCVRSTGRPLTSVSFFCELGEQFRQL